MSRSSIKRNAVLNAFCAVLKIAFPLVTFPYAARILLPDGIGQVNFANSVVSFFAIFADFGLYYYGSREGAKLRDDKAELSKFAKETFILNIGTCAISFAALLATALSIGKLREIFPLIMISSSQIIFSCSAFYWLYTAQEDYEYITKRQIAFQIFGIIFLYLFVHTKEDVNWYCAMGVLVNVGSNLSNFFHSRKFIDWKNGNSNFDVLKHVKPALPFLGIVLATSIYTIIDTSMLGLISDNVQTGFYSAANKINKLLLGIVTAATAVLLPRISIYEDKNERGKTIDLFTKAFCASLFFAIPAASGLMILREPIMTLVSGKDFLQASEAMLYLSPTFVAISLSTLIGMQLFTPLKKERYTLYAEILGVILNLSINLFLIPKYGALGAAIGSLIAECGVLLFELSAAWAYLKKGKTLLFFIQCLVASASMALALKFIKIEIPNKIIQTALQVILGAFTYAAVSLMIRNKAACEIVKFIQAKLKRRR